MSDKFVMPDIDAVLAFVWDSYELGSCSIRHYLVELSRRCWDAGHGFMRPSENCLWKRSVSWALIEGGFLHRDAKGNPSQEDCDKIISACFDRLQSGPAVAVEDEDEEIEVTFAEPMVSFTIAEWHMLIDIIGSLLHGKNRLLGACLRLHRSVEARIGR